MRLPYHRTIIVVSLIGFLICLALILSGCASTRTGQFLNGGVVGSASADYLSTRQAIQSGAGHEANALLGNGAIRQAVMKALGTSVVIGLAHEMDHTHGVLANVIRSAAIVGWSFAAVHNAGVRR